MRKKWLGIAALVVVLLTLFLEPTGVVRGTLSGEPFVEGRPAHVWADRLAGDPGTRAEAIAALTSAGADSVPVLSELAGDRSLETLVRLSAIEILVELGSEAAAAQETLIRATSDTDPHVRALAASALPKVDTPADIAVPALVPLLQGPHSIVASRALSEYREAAAAALPELVEVLKSETMTVEERWNAARTIGKLGPAGIDALPLLIEYTRHEEDTIREHAAEAIGDIGPMAAEGIPALVECLDDPATRVRRDAVRSLGYIGEPAVGTVEQIKPLLDDPEELVRTAARNALKTLAPDELPPETEQPPEAEEAEDKGTTGAEPSSGE